MAKNNKKNTNAPKKASVSVKAPEKKRVDGTKIFLIVFAAVALLGIIAAIVFGIINEMSKKRIDYNTANLKKYISISADDYKSFSVLLDLDRLVDENGNDTAALTRAIQAKILKLQYDNRTATNSKENDDVVISVGDTANIYYYGYTLDDNGNKVPFTGGSNLSGSVTSLGIGSGNFIPGFEAALVGVDTGDYRTLTKRSTGVVNDGNIITFTYTLVTFDGSAEMNKTATVDLSEDVDATWGNGFEAFVLGATVGEKITGDLVVTRVGEDGVSRSDVYSDITVNSVVEFSEGETLTIDATFPRPYTKNPELSGKSVKFDVYFDGVIVYNTPDFDETFITETLKVTAEDLADYEGASLVEKYTAKIRADLLKEHETKVNEAIDIAMWDHYLSVVKVKKLPKAEVKYFYNQQMNEINSYYETYSSYYTKFADAACDALQIPKGSDWQAAAQQLAEQSVIEKLIFYYIARTEGLIPDADEQAVLYEEFLQEMTDAYLKQAQVNREDFKTEEEYNEKVEYYRDLVLTNFGSAYINESVVYEQVMLALRKYATNITYAA